LLPATGRRHFLRIPMLLLVLLMAQIGWQGDQKFPRPPAVSEAMVDSMAADYYEAKLTCYPALATLKGIPGYDNRLSTYSQRSIFGLLTRIRNLGRVLATLDEDSLSMDKWVDYKALLADMAAQRFLLEDLELWRKRPTLYVDACVDGIVLLYLAEAGRDAPVDLAPRLRMIPQVVRQARRNLRNPCELHCRVASERLRDLIAMLKTLPAPASSPGIDQDLLDESVASLEAFGAFIDSLSLTADTEFALAYDDFLILLDTRNMISDMPEGTRTYAKSVLKRANEELRDYESRVPASAAGQAGAVDIEDLRARLAAALEFIDLGGSVGLPHGYEGTYGELRFLELPGSASPLYGDLLYIEPAQGSPEGGGALLYVSPEVAEPGATVDGIVPSEIVPGRHMQACSSARSPSPVCRLHTDIFTRNGWALYCQELMAREGFGGDRAIRDALLRRRFYAAGTIAAVNLLLGEFTVEAAAAFMVEKTGVSPAYARRLAVEYAVEPELAMSYIIGERQISQIRDEVVRISGDDFDLRIFHEGLLTSGCLPLYLLRNKLVSGSVGRR
jgi:hypothetical protein